MTMTVTQTKMPTLPPTGLQAIGGKRLCGSGRTADSVYLESGVYLYGSAIEEHLLDAPIPIDPVQYGLSAQGIKVVEINGVKHILDYVGASHYPEVADFLEEARRMGISRKIPITSEVTGLSSASTLMLVHSRGALTNAAAVSKDSHMVCPNGIHKPGENCAGLHWVTEPNHGPDHRKLSEGEYRIQHRRTGQPEAEYTHAIFMAAPLTCVTVIRNHDGSVHPRAMALAQSTGLPVNVADL